ncbi:MAG: hypothetical protein WCI94_22255 [Rhodospirillales bacterium]
MAVRVGNHTGFGRIVFDVAPGASYKLSRDGDSVAIVFASDTSLRKPTYAPSNVRSLNTVGDRAELIVAPGAALREMRIDGHVVIDVLDPAAPAKAPMVMGRYFDKFVRTPDGWRFAHRRMEMEFKG